jgi:hypothetical protein
MEDVRPDLRRVIAWHIEQGWRVVWRRGDVVLLAKWPAVDGWRWETWLRRALRMERPEYDRWWIDDADVLRSARSDRHGRIRGSVSASE